MDILLVVDKRSHPDCILIFDDGHFYQNSPSVGLFTTNMERELGFNHRSLVRTGWLYSVNCNDVAYVYSNITMLMFRTRGTAGSDILVTCLDDKLLERGDHLRNYDLTSVSQNHVLIDDNTDSASISRDKPRSRETTMYEGRLISSSKMVKPPYDCSWSATEQSSCLRCSHMSQPEEVPNHLQTSIPRYKSMHEATTAVDTTTRHRLTNMFRRGETCVRVSFGARVFHGTSTSGFALLLYTRQ